MQAASDFEDLLRLASYEEDAERREPLHLGQRGVISCIYKL